MHIRAATNADITAISQLICASVRKFIAPSCTEQGAELLLKSMDIQSITHYFDSDYQYSVAVINDSIIGVIGIRDNSHLYHLFVSKTH